VVLRVRADEWTGKPRTFNQGFSLFLNASRKYEKNMTSLMPRIDFFKSLCTFVN
jgi:hypothetical protein